MFLQGQGQPLAGMEAKGTIPLPLGFSSEQAWHTTASPLQCWVEALRVTSLTSTFGLDRWEDWQGSHDHQPFGGP
eukprot:4024114-Alexandrium_andersonii.AAC.1